MQALHEKHRITQSFTFDNVNQRLFVAQLLDRSDGNDLCINQLALDGTLVGYMYLQDVGHGVSIGVEPVGRDSFLWTECASSGPPGKGRGTALQRFRFVGGQEPVDQQTYLAGSQDITCATDPTSQRLLVRRRVEGVAEYTVHDITAAREGDFSRPLTHGIGPSISGTFQGYAFSGRYLYVLTGQGHADPADLDSAISCFDLYSGEVIQNHVPERAGSGLSFREPEGLAVYRAPGGQLSLCFGLASRDRLTGTLRFENIFCKNSLV